MQHELQLQEFKDLTDYRNNRAELKKYIEENTYLKEQVKTLQSIKEFHQTFEDFTNKEAKITANMKAMSDDKLKAIIDFLRYYKTDLLRTSLPLAHSDSGFQRRHGAIVQIDALIVFFGKSMKDRTYTDHITGEVKHTNPKKDED